MKNFIKRNLASNAKFYKLLSYLYHFRDEYWKPRIIHNLNEILTILSTRHEQVTFIQIGSNDGVSGDPLNYYIKKYKWNGILIEPLPSLFKKLRATYKESDNLLFINCAIGKNVGNLPLYKIDEKYELELPSWYFQLASFNKEMLFRHSIPDVEKYISKELVNVRTITSIVEEFRLQNVDLLHIDTEGYDFEILKTIDFNIVNPIFIIYEFCHLSISDFKRSISLLKIHNYKLLRCSKDIIAIKRKYYKSYKTGIKPFIYI